MFAFRMALALALVGLAQMACGLGYGQKMIKSGCRYNRLEANDFIMSDNRETMVVMEANGNLVVYDCHGRALWETRTGYGVHRRQYLEMQTDGNLVIYAHPRTFVWGSMRYPGPGRAPYHAIIQNDDNFCEYDKNNRFVWCTFTNGQSHGGCHACVHEDSECAEAIFAQREVPPPEHVVLQWYTWLWYQISWYRWRVLAATALAVVLVVLYRRKKAAAGKGEYTPLVDTEAMPTVA